MSDARHAATWPRPTPLTEMVIERARRRAIVKGYRLPGRHTAGWPAGRPRMTLDQAFEARDGEAAAREAVAS